MPGVEHIDLSPLLVDHGNVLLMAEGGGILFNWHEASPGGGAFLYEVHTNFLKPYRGRHAIRVSRNAYRWMFTHTDCMALLTKVPAFNKAADWFCGFVGATKEFERKAAWPTKDGPVDLAFWALRYDDWVRKCPEVVESGRKFHALLDEEFARLDKTEPNHADDECHDRHVGACVEMIYGGQPDKGIILYNRWARFAGYAEIGMVSRSPLVLDIGTALLQIDVPRETFRAIMVR